MNKPTSKKKKIPTSGDNQFRQILDDSSKKLGVQMHDELAEYIELFVSLLSEYNEHTNLVSNGDPNVVARDHVVDALTLVPLIEGLQREGKATQSLVDIGSGAGFPAMILALVFSDMEVLCIDSVGKKTRFLEQAIEALGLDDRVVAINARAETMAADKNYRASFDLATARAVGKLDLVSELAIPLLSVNGHLLAQKSTHQLTEELPVAHKALELLGGAAINTVAIDAEVVQRDLSVVIVRKVKQTPAIYPRPTAQLKRPLV